MEEQDVVCPVICREYKLAAVGRDFQKLPSAQSVFFYDVHLTAQYKLSTVSDVLNGRNAVWYLIPLITEQPCSPALLVGDSLCSFLRESEAAELRSKCYIFRAGEREHHACVGIDEDLAIIHLSVNDLFVPEASN